MKQIEIKITDNAIVMMNDAATKMKNVGMIAESVMMRSQVMQTRTHEQALKVLAQYVELV